jgi:pilus assembly protein CpaE
MQEEVTRIVLALESSEVAEEVMHFLDRSGRARVVGTASDERQLLEAIRQLEPDAVVASPTMAPARNELGGSGLLAVDTTQSVATLRRALRSGANGFFLWPAEREELAIAAGRARAIVDTGVENRASVVAVYGPRGGAGTTFVATHLAAAFAKRERRCVLVDLDVVFADASAAIGVPEDDESVRTIADLVPLEDEVSPVHVSEVLWRHADGFGALLAPGDELAAVSVRDHHYRSIVEAARRTCDVVVLHVPRGLDAIARTGLDLADRVVVVLGLDVVSFRDAKRAIATSGIEDRCAFVVNRASRSEVAPSDVERVFGQAPLAVIPADRSVRSSQDRGRLVPLRGRVGRQVDRLAKRILEDERDAERSKDGA